MEYRRLGRTDINVSAIGLGTMTWGEQNSEAEAHEQLDYAMACGINFIDAAEMYPVPPKAETQGRTEAYIGTWLNNRGRRDDLVLASKVVGRSNMDWYRADSSTTTLTRSQVREAIHASLERLQTDYIDLYQVHWPDRRTNFFGHRGYEHHPYDDEVAIEETLAALGELVAEGKVRHIGISNETPWGLMRYLELADRQSLPRLAAIQNPYSLLNRSFEIGLAECAEREDVPLLAYSPLAFGVLSGKYLNGARPEGARISRWERFSRYSNAEAETAARQYVDLAHQHGLDPAQMALAYINSRSFVASALVGATTMEQLSTNIASSEITLDQEVLDSIEAIHTRQPNPCP